MSYFLIHYQMAQVILMIGQTSLQRVEFFPGKASLIPWPSAGFYMRAGRRCCAYITD
jgi:hypothetical protein